MIIGSKLTQVGFIPQNAEYNFTNGIIFSGLRTKQILKDESESWESHGYFSFLPSFQSITSNLASKRRTLA